MKKLALFLTVLIISSCGNTSNTESVEEKPAVDTVVESTALPVEESPKNESPLTFLEEDSIAFFNSTKEEKKLIDEYCKCVKKNGNQSRDCRGFIKDLHVQQEITDKIWNKYFYNDKVSSQIGKVVEELNDQFNACGE